MQQNGSSIYSAHSLCREWWHFVQTTQSSACGLVLTPSSFPFWSTWKAWLLVITLGSIISSATAALVPGHLLPSFSFLFMSLVCLLLLLLLSLLLSLCFFFFSLCFTLHLPNTSFTGKYFALWSFGILKGGFWNGRELWLLISSLIDKP